MAGLRQIVDANPVFGQYLADPAISQADRWAALQRILDGRISHLLMNFLGVMTRNGRIRQLGEIAASYAALYDDMVGNVEVDVTSVRKLGPEDLEKVRQRVSEALGKNAIVHDYVDESILGGLVLRVTDRLIDASVRYQLQAMKQRLLAVRPK